MTLPGHHLAPLRVATSSSSGLAQLEADWKAMTPGDADCPLQAGCDPAVLPSRPQQGGHTIRLKTRPHVQLEASQTSGMLIVPCAPAGRIRSCWAASWRPPQSRSTLRLQLPGPRRPPKARAATTPPATSGGALSASARGTAPSNTRAVSQAGPAQAPQMLVGVPVLLQRRREAGCGHGTGCVCWGETRVHAAA